MMTPFVLVRLKAATRTARVGKRTLRHTGPFGNLHAVRVAEALRLVEAGEAKLLDQFRLARLREQVARLSEP
jgi:hypothetical protein